MGMVESRVLGHDPGGALVLITLLVDHGLPPICWQLAVLGGIVVDRAGGSLDGDV